MQKSTLFVALVAVLTIAIAFWFWPESAGDAPASQNGASNTTSSARTRLRPGVEVVLYFPNRRYVESGDESLDQLLSEPRRLEPDAPDVESLANAAVAALKAGPKSSAAAPAIPERVSIRQVRVRDRVAHLDLARAGLSGGSLEERLLVNSVVRTLTGTSQVRAVQFLVEGQRTETLMGHVSTAEPISGVD